MYVESNPKSKKALKELVAKGESPAVFQPGLGTVPTGEATVAVSGPHYPKPHTWYAQVRIVDGRIVKVIG